MSDRFSKGILLSASLLLLISAQDTIAQPVFTSGDFATLDDSFIVSSISVLDIPNHDYAATGMGFTWDYSDFNPISQRHVKFTDPNITGFRAAYIFSCNGICYNDCYNTCVSSGGFPLICAGTCNFNCSSTCLTNWFTKFDLAELANDSINLGITTVEDIFNFYDISQDALSQVAVGAKLSGFPIVMEYEIPDRVYSFPLEYANKDTSFSNYSLKLDSIPGTGIPVSLVYNHRQQRYNHVEGWGTLITPFGVFNNVLKLKSTVYNQDTVIFQNDTFALSQFLPTQVIPESSVEYKWFSPDFGIPLLSVSAWVIDGNLVYRNVEYIDTLRCFEPFSVFGYQPFPAVINQDEDSIEIGFYSLSVNGNSFTWDFDDPASASNHASGSNTIHTFSEGGVYNVQLVTCNTQCASQICDTFSLPVIIIDLSANDSTTGTLTQQKEGLEFSLSPNPFQDRVLINIKSRNEGIMNLQLVDVTGKLAAEIRAMHYQAGNHVYAIDLKRLPPGIYIACAVVDFNRTFFKMIKAPVSYKN
ncbi:MAG TPA: T9SS type A sorting domain-containing protein [Chitinophagales bacterium]|nr:T9SS type A sorting domain-containing protein [Chitinophagales bacterium]